MPGFRPKCCELGCDSEFPVPRAEITHSPPPRTPICRNFPQIQLNADNLTIMPAFERQHHPLSAGQNAVTGFCPLHGAGSVCAPRIARHAAMVLQRPTRHVMFPRRRSRSVVFGEESQFTPTAHELKRLNEAIRALSAMCDLSNPSEMRNDNYKRKVRAQ